MYLVVCRLGFDPVEGLEEMFPVIQVISLMIQIMEGRDEDTSEDVNYSLQLNLNDQKRISVLCSSPS